MSPTPGAEPITFVWHPRTRRHIPSAEIRLGIRRPSTEVPERVNSIRDALIQAGHPEVTAGDPDPTALLAVHTPGLIEHLRTINDAWVVADYATTHGQDRVVPTVIPTAAMLAGVPVRRPTAAHARAGLYCYDTATLIGPGTWDAAEAAAGAALTAVDLISQQGGIIYALCRPPGHHAAADAFGAGCYLNNAAIAAAELRRRGASRVAVIDIGAHHGNGTQAIFYERPDVFVGSVHVDPGAGSFPHFLGFADETGRGDGVGANLNLPLPSRAGDERWLPAVAQLLAEVRAFDPDALVVALGVDAVHDDPQSPLRISEQGLQRTGELIGALGLPTVAVQEGGFHLQTLGPLVLACLRGLAAGAALAGAAGQTS